MEVIGAAASIIAIGQALVAARHGFNLLKQIPEIGKDFEALDHELPILLAMVDEATIIGEIVHQTGLNAPFLLATLSQLGDITNELRNIESICTQQTASKNRLKIKKARWLLVQTRISKLHAKANGAKLNLQTALHTMTLRMIQSHTDALSKLGQRAISDTEVEVITSPNTSPSSSRPDDAIAFEPYALQQQNLQNKPSSFMTEKSDTWFETPKLKVEECFCECHEPFHQKVERRQLLRLGYLSVVLSGISRCQCRRNNCIAQKDIGGTFQVWFPEWISSRKVLLQTSINASSGLTITLRPLRRLCRESRYWVYKASRGVRPDAWEIMPELWAEYGPFYPDDDFGNELDFNLIELVCAGRYDLLRFFMRIWSSSLLQKACSRVTLLSARYNLDHDLELEDWAAQLLRRIISVNDGEYDYCENSLHQAVNQGDLQEVISAFEMRPWTLDHRNHHGLTPLMLAVVNGNLAIVEQLIAFGADINQRGPDGGTALMNAAIICNIDIILALLRPSMKADINATSHNGFTALMYGTASDNPQSTTVMDALLQAGAKTSSRVEGLLGPMHSLCVSRSMPKETKRRKMRMLLRREPCNPRETLPILICASISNDITAVECLLEAGYCFADTAYLGDSSLHWVAGASNAAMMRKLKPDDFVDSRVHMLDSSGDTPWDRFVLRLHKPRWLLAGWIETTQDDKDAFCELYIGIRNKTLSRNIGQLEEVLESLMSRNAKAARERLSSLMSFEEYRILPWQLETYRTVDLQVRQGMWEAAVESAEENLEVLRKDMKTSPWSYPTKCCQEGYCQLSLTRNLVEINDEVVEETSNKASSVEGVNDDELRG